MNNCINLLLLIKELLRPNFPAVLPFPFPKLLCSSQVGRVEKSDIESQHPRRALVDEMLQVSEDG